MPGVGKGKRRPYLEGKDADATRALREHNLPGLYLLEAVEAVPRRHGGTRQGGRLDVVKVPRGPHQSRLGENPILAQGSVEHTPDAAGPRIRGHGAVHAPLQEQGGHFVALLELSDLGTDCDDFPCAV